jgi:hypothetical protein
MKIANTFKSISPSSSPGNPGAPVTIQVDTSAVIAELRAIRVAIEACQIVVNVPDATPPVVHVAAPEVTVHVPEGKTEAPTVHVSSAPATILQASQKQLPWGKILWAAGGLYSGTWALWLALHYFQLI